MEYPNNCVHAHGAIDEFSASQSISGFDFTSVAVQSNLLKRLVIFLAMHVIFLCWNQLDLACHSL
jgi:hypothetical protein